MATSLNNLNLLALADQGIAQSQERSDTLYGQQLGWSNSAIAEQEGLLASLLSGDQRSQEFDSQQNLLDAALKRQEASMAAATARAQASSGARSQAAEDEEWYRRQVFSTNEAIRQAATLALAEGTEDPPFFHARDFGGTEIAPARGRALKRDFGTKFAPTPAEYDRVKRLVALHGEDPTKLLNALRTAPTSDTGGLGNKTRTASWALADMGYGQEY